MSLVQLLKPTAASEARVQRLDEVTWPASMVVLLPVHHTSVAGTPCTVPSLPAPWEMRTVQPARDKLLFAIHQFSRSHNRSAEVTGDSSTESSSVVQVQRPCFQGVPPAGLCVHQRRSKSCPLKEQDPENRCVSPVRLCRHVTLKSRGNVLIARASRLFRWCRVSPKPALGSPLDGLGEDSVNRH